MNKKTCFLFLLIFFSSCLQAQDLLTLSQALELTLKNNTQIRIITNETKRAENENTAGNAGMLPSVAFNAGTNFSVNNVKQELSSGTEIKRDGAQAQNINAGIGLNWTLFDGMKMFVTKNKLGELDEQSKLQLKIQIENTVFEVIQAYYNVVKQLQVLQQIDSTLSIYDERLKIAERRLTIGNGSKMDVLQAQMDHNTQKALRIRQRTLLSDAKIALNKILQRAADVDFTVENNISIDKSLANKFQKDSLVQKNKSLLFAKKSMAIKSLEIKESRSYLLPRVSTNVNYNFTKTQNQAGFILLNQNAGLNAGLTASWTFFDGFNNSRKVKNAELSYLNEQYIFTENKLSVESAFTSALIKYQNSIEILGIEEENLSLASENLKIVLERFKIGNISSLEFRAAQTTYEEVLNRKVTAAFESKMSEAEILRLNGDLVKE